MTTITVSVPEELKKEIDKQKYINWSAVAREAFMEKIHKLVLFEAIVAKSKLTEKDAEEIGNKISQSMHEQYKKQFPWLK